MATKHKIKIKVLSGPQALQEFMKEYGRLFNLTQIERMCALGNGKLRHISAGSRSIDNLVYEVVQKELAPILYQLLFILQNNESQESVIDFN